MGILSKKKVKVEEESKLRSAPEEYKNTYEEPLRDEPLPGEEEESVPVKEVEEAFEEEPVPEPVPEEPVPEEPVQEEPVGQMTLEGIAYNYQLLLHDIKILVSNAQFQQATIRKEEWKMLIEKEKIEEILKANGVTDEELKNLQEGVA